MREETFRHTDEELPFLRSLATRDQRTFGGLQCGVPTALREGERLLAQRVLRTPGVRGNQFVGDHKLALLLQRPGRIEGDTNSLRRPVGEHLRRNLAAIDLDAEVLPATRRVARQTDFDG